MKISKNIRREVEVKGSDFIVWMGPKGLLFKEKRKRSGRVLSWEQLLAHAEAVGVEAKALDGDCADADGGSADVGGDAD